MVRGFLFTGVFNFYFLWSAVLLQESAFPAEQVSTNELLLVLFTQECLKFPFTLKGKFCQM